MIYQSRKRKYKSRRERYNSTTRFIRIVAVFGLIAGVIWVFFRRQYIWDWVRTFFY